VLLAAASLVLAGEAPPQEPPRDPNEVLVGPVTIAINDASLGQAIDLLIGQCGLNVIVPTALADDEELRVNMSVRGVPLRDVVQGLAAACGINYQITDGGLVIFTAPEPEPGEDENADEGQGGVKI
jgi:hypothetical protein